MKPSANVAELERAIEQFLQRTITPVRLQVMLWGALAPEHGTPLGEPAVQLWHGAVTNLAFYHYCDVERSVLDESLRLLLESVRQRGVGCLTPITSSPCFIEAVKTGQIPAPLDPRHFNSINVVLPDRASEGNAGEGLGRTV
ncbi:MAG: hypothetical protein KC438_08200 [Thermomicrobiales bacterium]|nr:hypothetical protein [Thermomicrobiales bacterium]MCO5222668.1 hypothetical protein [Thermomicrobiales bacterium]